ncbi:MAG TPA: hypothetical protein VGB68_13875 [Pyrinomonadaceae bacterium]
MPANEQDVINLIKAGKLDASELEQMFSSDASLSGLVTVTDWGICYSSATGQLSEFATVTSNSSSNPITGIGLIAYSSNSSKMFCVQYTNGFSSNSIATSIGTTLYNPQTDGSQAACVVYGWTNNGSFYVPQTMTIGSC